MFVYSMAHMILQTIKKAVLNNFKVNTQY